MAWTVEGCIERGKREIRADIASGAVPGTVASFAELHDYVDANGYGGAFDDDAPDPTDCDFWNSVQDGLDRWIKSWPELLRGIESMQRIQSQNPPNSERWKRASRILHTLVDELEGRHVQDACGRKA